MRLSLGQAAKHSGFSKPTLSRAIKNGKLSATRLDDGSFSIDPAELERWKDNNGHRNHQETQIATQDETHETPKDSSSIEVELKVLRERLRIFEAEREHERRAAADQVTDLRRRLDQSEQERRDAHRQITALLTDQRVKADATTNPAPKVDEQPKRRWWHFGRAND